LRALNTIIEIKILMRSVAKRANRMLRSKIIRIARRNRFKMFVIKIKKLFKKNFVI